MANRFMPIEPNDTVGSFVDREDSLLLQLKKIKSFYLGAIPVDMNACLKDGDRLTGSPPVQ